MYRVDEPWKRDNSEGSRTPSTGSVQNNQVQTQGPGQRLAGGVRSHCWGAALWVLKLGNGAGCTTCEQTENEFSFTL